MVLAFAMLMGIGAVSLTGCDKSAPVAQSDIEQTDNIHSQSQSNDIDDTFDKQALEVLAGCYTISHDEPAQIKVSQQNDGWVMQMKEPASAHRVWDDPEPLEVIHRPQVSDYFSVESQYVDAMLARPDRVMVLAHVQPVYVNLEPLLDSEYLAFIYKGANTIYRVPCDDIHTDIINGNKNNKAKLDVTDNVPTSPHQNIQSNIVIKNLGQQPVNMQGDDDTQEDNTHK